MREYVIIIPTILFTHLISSLYCSNLFSENELVYDYSFLNGWNISNYDNDHRHLQNEGDNNSKDKTNSRQYVNPNSTGIYY